jgi:hypothetical protein
MAPGVSTNGLSGGALPSGFIRSSFPWTLVRSWELGLKVFIPMAQ